MAAITRTTFADAEEQAASGYEHDEALTQGTEVVDEAQKAPAAPLPAATAVEPQVSESSSAEATKTAGALLDAWFESAIHNSEYSRDAASYNLIQKQYRALRALIT